MLAKIINRSGLRLDKFTAKVHLLNQEETDEVNLKQIDANTEMTFKKTSVSVSIESGA